MILESAIWRETAGNALVHQDGREQPANDERAGDRDEGPAGRVERAEAELAQHPPGAHAELAAEPGDERRRDHQEDERDERLRELAVHVRVDEDDQDGPEHQAEEEAAEGDQLDRGAEPEPAGRGERHQHDDHSVEDVHLAGVAPPVPEGTAVARLLVLVPAEPLRGRRRADRRDAEVAVGEDR